MTLSRLSRREVAELAQTVAGKPLPPEVLDHIVAKTDGIPLFVEELTKAILESGLLKESGGRYLLDGPLIAITVPSTLRDSLMARLDRLSSVKEVIQAGAVIGREFSHALLTAVLPVPSTELDATLRKLIASELIFRRGSGNSSTLVFKHALIQDAAYESILKSRRRAIHGRVAETIEKDFPDIAASNPGLVAMHAEQAGNRGKAVDWHIKAGHLAQERSASREAIQHFSRALELVEKESDFPGGVRVELHANLGRLYASLEGFTSETAMTHFLRAQALFPEAQSDETKVQTLVGHSEALLWLGRLDDGLEVAKQILDFANRHDNRVYRMYAMECSSRINTFRGRPRLSLQEARTVIDAYDESQDIRLAFRYGYDPGTWSLQIAAYQCFLLGYLDDAVCYADRAIALARKTGHPYTMTLALAWAGADFGFFIRDADRVLAYAQEGEALGRRHGFSFNAALCTFHRGWAQGQLGAVEEGLTRMTTAREEMLALGVRAILGPRFTAQLAAVHGSIGNADEGLRVLATAPDRAPGAKRIQHAEIFRMEGDLHLALPKPDVLRAETLYREAIATAVEHDHKIWHLRAAVHLARLCVAEGRSAAAEALLRPIYEGFTQGFDLPDLIDAQTLLNAITIGASGASVATFLERK